MRHFGTRSSTAALAASSDSDSAATLHRKAMGMVTVSLSMTWTLKPSTAWAPICAACTVADSCAPRWIEMHPSWSRANLLYTSANSPGDGADLVSRLVAVLG